MKGIGRAVIKIPRIYKNVTEYKNRRHRKIPK